MIQSRSRLRAKFFPAFVATVFAVSPIVESKRADASDRGAIAGAIIGGIGAAIIAGQIANASRQPTGNPPSSRRKHVRTPKKEKAVAKSETATEAKVNADPFAGVVPTRVNPVHGD